MSADNTNTVYEPTTSPDEWETLRATLFQTPEDQEEYDRTLREVVAVRTILQAVDAERERIGISKKELAERVGMNAVVVRRLLTAEDSNPTFKTMLSICAALDLEIQIKPARRYKRRKKILVRQSASRPTGTVA